MFPPPSDASAKRHDQLMTAMRQWRAAHPDATLAEIERAVDQHLGGVRAEVIQAVVADAPEDRPMCPDCGTALVRVGHRSRHLRTAHDGTLTFTDPAWRCPACGAGLFPPD